MGTSTYVRPNYTTQLAAAYKGNIDAAAKVFERMAAAFAPHEQSAGSPAPDLTVVVDAGAVWDGSSLAEKPQQTVTGFTIPASGTRIDRIVLNPVTGDAIRIAGTAVAGSPSATAPAIPAGTAPLCQVSIASTDTAITNDMITDERVFLLPQRPTFVGVNIGDGSAAAPSAKFGEEQNGFYSPAAGMIAGVSNGAEGWRLDATQNFSVYKLFDISAAAAGQIKFPATQNASADANTFDDYEEGTWTPAITFTTPGDLSVTYDTQAAQYTKFAREVTIRWAIDTATFTHTTASGNFNITGVPFASGVVTGLIKKGTCTWYGITQASYTDINPAINVSGSTVVDLEASGSGLAISKVTAAHMPTGGVVRNYGQLTYTV